MPLNLSHKGYSALSKLALASLAVCSFTTAANELGKSAESQASEKINWRDKGWELVWQDEFNDAKLDRSKWNVVVNCWGGGNNEQQCYVDKPDNFEFENGKLHIVARKEEHTGPAERERSPNYDPNNTKTLPYTSGRIRTNNKGDWKYGRFEARMKLPYGQGTWPAFWMLPTDEDYGGWAASGEIDIMEAVNIGAKTDANGKLSDAPETRIHGTLHYGAAWPNNVYTGTAYKPPGGFSPATGYHTYAVEWEEGEIRWYMDDVHYATQTAEGWYSEYTDEAGNKVRRPQPAPFDKRYHLIFNNAVGGAWASNVNEKGIDPDIFPQRLSIDYVRVYQCSKDPETGKGCASISEGAKLVKPGDGH
ncbi:glycoside hydrolase family 16 protein [Planctobacterium marinum]|uniref:Beta-glucanase n=1 Tax=Planctobacterium marinum TaxID=1631968 RepID=A0AA48HHQ2_9ALTE|nr:beta-glucanase [Planctobacterium marinum]